MTPNKQTDTLLSCIEYITDCKHCHSVKLPNKRFHVTTRSPLRKKTKESTVVVMKTNVLKQEE